jgi:hypothetical protein
MIRIERVPLPDGLRALAHRDPDGGLLIYVSSTLDAPVQRIAVMAAVRASRQSEGRTAAPLGLALLAGLRLGLGNWRGAGPALGRRVALARHIRHVRPVGWAAGSAVAAGAVVAGLILTAPAHLHPAAAPRADDRTARHLRDRARHPGLRARLGDSIGLGRRLSRCRLPSSWLRSSRLSRRGRPGPVSGPAAAAAGRRAQALRSWRPWSPWSSCCSRQFRARAIRPRTTSGGRPGTSAMCCSVGSS